MDKLFVLLVADVFVPWWQERRRRGAVESTTRSVDRWLRIGVTAMALLGAAASVTTVAQAGHSGSESVWSDVVNAKS